MRFTNDDQDAAFLKYQKALDEASGKAAVQLVLKAALADQGVSHRVYHELGQLARAKSAGRASAAATDPAPGKKGAKA
ncbi:MAG: hypothetical protein FWC58_06655 [Desulfobulbus sp.]|nr:hypothetical protein [Desulfobulbus sp.]